MENRHLKSYIIISALIMLSCTENKSTILETPFVTVVKLVSAEQSLAFEEVRKSWIGLEKNNKTSIQSR